MNIAMLTTWNSACGIAEYSRNLVKEFLKLGHNVLVLNNTTDGESIRSGAAFVTSKVFGVHWWGEDPTFKTELALDMLHYFEGAVGPIAVFHVQYQGSLYEPEGFNKLVENIKCKKVITLRDSSKNSKHNLDIFNDVITHSFRPTVRRHQQYHGFLFPTIERTPMVFSFGMGRNDYAFIEKACKEIGIDFEGHDARKNGWLSEEALFEKMNNADAIVLWYNDVPIEGQSAALRTAISSMRPVIVNDVGWFKNEPPFVYKVRTKDELQNKLLHILNLYYIRQNSFQNCAEKYLEVFSEVKKA